MMQARYGRRAVLRGALAAGGALSLGAPSSLGAPMRAHAAYGAAVRVDALESDAAYAEAIAARCKLIVPEASLKWPILRPTRDAFRFEEADRIAAFARARGLSMRGHTLAWYGGMPTWAEAITGRAEAERVLTGHIETVVARYRGLVTSWDVVNEPMPETPASARDLRPFVWTRTLGADYIPIAFRAAAAADPSARLVLNEYDIEFTGTRYARRRDGILAIARSLLDKGVPIHGIGLQAHLFADRTLDRDGLQGFLKEIRAMKLDVLVTELDVIDDGLPTAFEARDALVAKAASAFLTAVAEVSPPSAILTWGISDRYTWVPIYFKRADGTGNRPLPLDADMRPKPLMAVIERFTGTAS